MTTYCNTHDRRDFKGGSKVDAIVARRMVEGYSEIYKLAAEAKGLKRQTQEKFASKRKEMVPHFESILDHQKTITQYSIKSSLGQAFNYFIGHHEGLTYFLNAPDVPNDNNASERIFQP